MAAKRRVVWLLEPAWGVFGDGTSAHVYRTRKDAREEQRYYWSNGDGARILRAVVDLPPAKRKGQR